MENKPDYFDDLRVIKKIMEDSSRFLSLSGLSGIFAGLIALFGCAVAFLTTANNEIHFIEEFSKSLFVQETSSLRTILIIDAIAVLVLAIGASLYYSYRKSQRQGLRIWTPISRRLLINFLVPLVSGGFFIIILFFQNQGQLIIPAMLVFYGLALVNAGKFTYSEVFYLGLAEISTGFVSAFLPYYAIHFWCLGFGILHIAYGLFMYRKYEI